MSQKHDRDAAQSDAAYAGMHPQLAADGLVVSHRIGSSKPAIPPMFRGCGVFEDLGGNAVIGRMIAKACRQDGKIVGALCSGVSALLGAQPMMDRGRLPGNV
jgi:hypothetical protein